MPLSTDSFSMASISADLQEYALDHQEYIINEVFSIGFGGAPNSPIKPLDDYVNILPADGEVVLTDLITGDPLQPGNKGSFDPKDDYAALKTRKAKPEAVKVDLLFKEDKIRALYNTYMARVRMLKYDPETLPFEQWLTDRLAKDVQKYMRVAMFTGVTNQAAGTSSVDIFDGWIEQITDIILNDPADINTVDLELLYSNLTIDNIIDTFEKMADALPAEFAYAEDTVMIVPKALRDLYNKGYRKAHGGNTNNDGFERLQLDGTNVDIIVEPGITAFNRPIITTRENLVFLYNDMGSVNFDYQKRDRSLAYLMDFEAGVGMCASERLWIGTFTAP
jgi:hypothetical protein